MATVETTANNATMEEPKFYKGGKSKALRALKAFGAAAEAAAQTLLFPNAETGEWGFYPLDAKRVQEQADALASAPVVAPVAPVDPTINEIEEQNLPNAGSDDAPASNAFGAVAATLASVPAAPPAQAVRAASRNSYTIEKNRPEQNGVKRPSEGGLCRAVWDACDDLRTKAGGVTPSSKEVRALAETKNWNKNNAMIEYYNWRKFNGITGRAKPAPEAAPAPAQAAEPEVQEHATA